MRDEARRLVADLRAALVAEAELPGAPHLLVPRANPRPPPAGELLARIALEVKACTRCGLSRTRHRTVPGEGSPTAAVMLVGEAPGHDEDRRGRPFVGKAGQLLDRMLAAIDIRREDVYIANILKCRPPGNRDPDPDEIEACRPYLIRQIVAVRPRFLVTLGRVPAHVLLGTTLGITRIRGIPREFPHPGGTATLLPMFHPSYLLRNPRSKREAWADLKLLRRLLE